MALWGWIRGPGASPSLPVLRMIPHGSVYGLPFLLSARPWHAHPIRAMQDAVGLRACGSQPAHGVDLAALQRALNRAPRLVLAAETPSAPAALSSNDFRNLIGRGEWIRTTDLLIPNQEISTTYEHRSLKTQDLRAFCLDPIWTLKANVWRTGPLLDPAWTLVSTLVIRLLPRTRAVASPSQKPDQNYVAQTRFQNRHIGARAQHATGRCRGPNSLASRRKGSGSRKYTAVSLCKNGRNVPTASTPARTAQKPRFRHCRRGRHTRNCISSLQNDDRPRTPLQRVQASPQRRQHQRLYRPTRLPESCGPGRFWKLPTVVVQHRQAVPFPY
jgi:hypothetical protein